MIKRGYPAFKYIADKCCDFTIDIIEDEAIIDNNIRYIVKLYLLYIINENRLKDLINIEDYNLYINDIYEKLKESESLKILNFKHKIFLNVIFYLKFFRSLWKTATIIVKIFFWMWIKC